MFLNWKDRLEHQPNFKDFNKWPFIDISLIDCKVRKGFIRNKRIVKSVIEGNSLKSTSKRFGISVPRISQILGRCLSGDIDDIPPLTKALIPGIQLNIGERIKPLSTISNPSGCRGSFNLIFKTLPVVKEKLDEIILLHIKNKSHGQNITAKYFHKEFIKLLNDNNWPNTSYPFDQNTLGYESCRKYLIKRTTELSIKKKKPKRQIYTIDLPKRPYQEVQIDSQLLDINTHVNLEFKGTIVPMRLSRVTLFLATDVATGCRLAYHLCINNAPTQLDLLNLLEKIHRPWEKIELKTPGLEYQPGACLPNSLGEIHQNAGIALIRLDNAYCHLSNMARDYVCNILGGTLNLGIPAQPKGRNYIEHAFNILNENIHRFPSTTGSHVKDPKKETKINSKKIPIISINALKEVLDIIITNHNITVQESLGSLNPLEMMRIKSNDYIPLSFMLIHKNKNSFLNQKKVTVKWLSHENRSPHINFKGLRYVSNDLNDPNLPNTQIIIEYDIRDIRIITAINTNGEYIGKLYAPKSWQSFPFSITTKKRISELTKQKRIRSSDPLSGYFRYLVNNRELPKHATELVRIYEEFSSGSLNLTSTSDIGENEINSFLEFEDSIPDWSPELVQERI